MWTANEMIVWGGWNANSYFNTGGRYDPRTDSWTATSTTNAPRVRTVPTAVSTGTEMIVWGGHIDDYPNYTNTGGDTILARIVGQPPPLLTRPLSASVTRQSGPAVK